MSSFHRILAGWDGSRDARQAFRSAVHLAEQVGAEVVVLAAVKRHSHAEIADQAAEEMAARRREAVTEMTAEARHDGVPASVSIRHEVIEADQTAPALEEYVREHGFDLVAVGRHGVDRVAHPRIGGVSEHQVRHSSRPVMVVGSD